MRFLIQRVNHAKVTVEGKTTGEIEKGYLVLIGISQWDTIEMAQALVKKMIGLRIFEDDQGKTNLSLEDVGGSLLLVSQFTLYADCRKGNRPSFIKAMNPTEAQTMYQKIITMCQEAGVMVACGEFGADMKVSLENDGPFTVLLETDENGKIKEA